MNALWTALVVLGLSANTAAASQTCMPDTPRTAPDSRYTINGDGTVTDSQTSLMWKQCSEGLSGPTCSGALTRMRWPAAMDLNEETEFAGFDDWRLPRAEELWSLVESACIDPAINQTYFPNTFSGGYWSSSSAPEDNDYIRYVDFRDAKRDFNGKSTFYGVRLVRNAQ